MDESKSSPIILESGVVKTSTGQEYYRVRIKSQQNIPVVKTQKKFFEKLLSLIK